MCAARVVCNAVCALAPATDNEQAPVKATNIAAVLIRIITSHHEAVVDCNVSDCRTNVNCGVDFAEACNRTWFEGGFWSCNRNTRIQLGKIVYVTKQPALNRRNVANHESTLAG